LPVSRHTECGGTRQDISLPRQNKSPETTGKVGLKGSSLERSIEKLQCFATSATAFHNQITLEFNLIPGYLCCKQIPPGSVVPHTWKELKNANVHAAQITDFLFING
jgi:hypothetical protein